MEVSSAEFVISNTDIDKCPKPTLAEFAFIGRSNVGKSSLINMLANKKDLAKTSSTPGKTQLINHFLVNKNMYWVDLPGYGFAKVSQQKRKSWTSMIWNYLEKRENLLITFLLIDGRHKPQQIDLDFMNKLGEKEIPFHIIITKSDKENQKTIEGNVRLLREALSKTWEESPMIHITSSVKRSGSKSIYETIKDGLNWFMQKNNQ